MRAVTPAFLDTLRGSHRVYYRATVCDTFQTGVAPTGTDIPVMGGTFTVDGNADLRSSLTLVTDGTRMWPRFASDLFAPYGNEVFIEIGILHAYIEYVGLGYLRIQAPSQDDVPDGPITLTCEDRMAAIKQARLLAPRSFTAGTTLGSIVTSLVTEVYPSAVIEWDDNTDTTTLARMVIVEEDRFGFIDDLVKARGKIWYFDYRGVLVIKDLPDESSPVYEINSGYRGVLVTMSRFLTREGVYNAVVALGEGGDTETPAYGVSLDNTPSSPTYFYGRFGQVPRFYSSPFIATNPQAITASATLLRRQLGLPYVIDFGAVPNPALEPFDPVLVRYSDRDAPETHVLEQITLQLTEQAPMTATTKEKRLTLIGTVS